MSQTTIQTHPSLALPGLVDSASGAFSETCIAGEAIAFGLAVNRVSGNFNPTVEVVDASGDVTGLSFVGVAARDFTGETSAALVGYETGDTMKVCHRGRVWVVTEEVVNYGEPVFVRHTADTAPLDVVGRFRNDAGTGAVQLPGARFIGSVSASLALVELNP